MGSTRKVFLIILLASIGILAFIGVYSRYCVAHIVVGEYFGGRTVHLSGSLTEEQLHKVQGMLSSSEFLERVKNKNQEDSSLLAIWTTHNTQFKINSYDDRISFHYSVPRYSISYFRISEFTHYHGSTGMHPELEREILLRHQRIEQALLKEVENVILEAQQ